MRWRSSFDKPVRVNVHLVHDCAQSAQNDKCILTFLAALGRQTRSAATETIKGSNLRELSDGER